VRLRPVLLALVLTAPLGACAPRSAPQTNAPDVPTSIADLDRFAIALNQFALLPEDHPKREPFRGVLVDYLAGYIDKTLADQRPEEATNALQFAAALWRPGELRGPRKVEPRLTAAAHRLYRAAARRGQEGPALFATAIEQQFGDDAGRARAIATWTEIEGWVVRNGNFSDEPVLRHEELESAIEETAANFPSPFVVQRLADLYVARYEAAIEASSSGENPELALAARHRAEVTGYLLTRLYLRADDFDGAIKALGRVEIDVPSRKLLEFVESAKKPARSAGPLLTLAAQFIPDEDDEGRIPPSFITQGWGIVENLARRAVVRHPDDAFAHLLLARSLRQQGLVDASIVHLGRTVAIKEDIFDAWQDLAILKQSSLERLAGVDVDAALQRLAELEQFHARAVELWSGRPIRPGLSEAYFTVAESLYELGRVDPAKHLLEKSVQREPLPEALDLLATIEQKSGRPAEAARHYEALVGLPFDDQLTRLRWETQARLALGLIERKQGDEAGAKQQLDTALRQLNKLIGFPGLRAGDRSARLVERGKLLFYVGDPKQGAEDFRQARTVTPDRPEAYIEPMIFVVNHGYYDLALEIFRQAQPREEIRGSLKLYFCLWLHELALRQNHTQDPAVLEFLRTYEGDAWQRKLAAHAQGQLSYDELLRGASDSGEQAEAYFYEALRRWRSGDPTNAKDLMRKVLGTRRMAFFEYDMAQNYLEWNDLPASARPPR
jgi:tetratricopeptide (TPR) repeat protein